MAEWDKGEVSQGEISHNSEQETMILFRIILEVE